MRRARTWGWNYAGHSTGGGIGVATVLDFPGRLRSLLICCSTTCGDPYRQKLLGLRRRLYELLGGEAYAQFRTLLLYPPYWINEHHRELAAEEERDGGDLGGPEVQSSRLNAILAFVEQLSEVDVAGIEPMTSVTPMVMKKREDKITDGGISDDILKNAPVSEDHFFLVPKVVE